MFWCNFVRRPFTQHLIHTSRHCTNSAAKHEAKKLYIRNVFKDNPSAKYYLLTVVAVTLGTTYYVYNNQEKKKFILDMLPAAPNHYTVTPCDKIAELKSCLERARNGDFHELQIFGSQGSGKTQVARHIAESVKETRNGSFQFKLWPKDEVTITLLAQSKESLLASYKQLASKLGCEPDDVKLASHAVEQQLDVFSLAVKEKLRRKPCWILVVDNLNERIPLRKWLPDSDWGNGYVINTVNAQGVTISENESWSANVCMSQMTSGLARQLFFGITSETASELEDQKELLEGLLESLYYNPLSIACAALFYKHKVQRHKNYTLESLCATISQTVKRLEEMHPKSNKLQIIQTCTAALATRSFAECSPELLHVFDFLGSCSVGNPIPVSLFSHHLKTPAYHVQMKQEETAEPVAPTEESSLSMNSSLEQEHNIWSFRGVVDRGVKFYERLKLEFDAIKGLFGYGNEVLIAQAQSTSDGLDVIRRCPLFIISHEPMADIEVVTVHPIIHNVLRQVFPSVTIPLLEQQHLLLAERKHQQKSYFGRLRSFDPQSSITEYRRSLGDIASLEVGGGKNFDFVFEKPRLCVDSILRSSDGDDVSSESQSWHTFAHSQEHLSRVVNSLGNHYRIAGGDGKVLVARALLLPHLKALLKEGKLTAASKTRVYRTMASIYSEVLGDGAASKELLNEAYTVTTERYGEESLEIAEILTEQAELCSTREEYGQSKQLLERAIEIYQKNIKSTQTNKQPFQYGKSLVALGVTCNSLGETSRSKDLLERGLMELQNAAPGDPQAKENKWFAAEISSAVTNLGHAYLSLGKINQGRKLLELALIGHQNVHGDVHHEVMRTLTTLSIAHAMQGNSRESKRLRNEAGKIKKKLDTRAPLFLHQ